MSPQAGFGQDPQQAQINPQTGQPFSEAEMAQMAAMLGTYGDQLELGSMEGQQAQADALRNAKLHDERSNGRVTTAANPLELLGTVAQQYVGKRMNDKLDKKGGELRGRIGENVKQYGLLGLGAKKPAPRLPPDPLATEAY